MILYTNGTGHTAGAQAVVPFSRADEDKSYWNLEDRPHPANLRATWGPILADWLKMSFHTDARVTNNNVNIIEQTQTWIHDHNPESIFIILQFGQVEGLERDYGYVKAFYEYLDSFGYNFLFFNGDQAWLDIPEEERYNFNNRYMNAYSQEDTFTMWLSNQGYDTVITSNEYFGQQAHAAWAKHLMKHIIENNML